MTSKIDYIPPHMRDQDTINELLYTDHGDMITDDVFSHLSREAMEVIYVPDEIPF